MVKPTKLKATKKQKGEAVDKPNRDYLTDLHI